MDGLVWVVVAVDESILRAGIGPVLDAADSREVLVHGGGCAGADDGDPELTEMCGSVLFTLGSSRPPGAYIPGATLPRPRRRRSDTGHQTLDSRRRPPTGRSQAHPPTRPQIARY